MPRPVVARAEITNWEYTGKRLRGCISNDITGFYPEGVQVTLIVESVSDYGTYYIFKTVGSIYMALKDKMKLRQPSDD